MQKSKKRAPLRDTRPQRKAGAKVPRPQDDTEKSRKPSPIARLKALQEAKAAIPAEFDQIWAPALAFAWAAMNERQQSFLKTWYLNGFNGTKAYQEAYGISDEHIARVSASRLLATVNVFAFRQAIQDTLKPPLERIQEVYIHALEAEKPIFADGDHIADVEDHAVRMVAAEKLLKMHSLEKPAQVTVNHTGSVTLTIDTKNIQAILNGSDKP